MSSSTLASRAMLISSALSKQGQSSTVGASDGAFDGVVVGVMVGIGDGSAVG